LSFLPVLDESLLTKVKRMDCIWKGDMIMIADVIRFRAILENTHTWAMREQRPRLSTYIDLWRMRCGIHCDPTSCSPVQADRLAPSVSRLGLRSRTASPSIGGQTTETEETRSDEVSLTGQSGIEQELVVNEEGESDSPSTEERGVEADSGEEEEEQEQEEEEYVGGEEEQEVVEEEEEEEEEGNEAEVMEEVVMEEEEEEGELTEPESLRRKGTWGSKAYHGPRSDEKPTDRVLRSGAPKMPLTPPPSTDNTPLNRGSAKTPDRPGSPSDGRGYFLQRRAGEPPTFQLTPDEATGRARSRGILGTSDDDEEPTPRRGRRRGRRS
jgi:hypothetical protein